MGGTSYLINLDYSRVEVVADEENAGLGIMGEGLSKKQGEEVKR